MANLFCNGVRAIAPFVLGVAFWCACAPDAQAGAWTKRQHDGLFIGGLAMHWLDPFDQPARFGTLKIETFAYVEYGLTDRITLVGRGAVQQLFDRVQPAKKKRPPPRTGIGGLEAGVRIGLFERGRWASSLQVMAGIPGSGENWNNEAFGARGGDVDLRVQIGRSIGQSGFIEVATGMRLRGEDARDEVRLDLTAGCDVFLGTQLMVQSYSVWAVTDRNGQTGYGGHRLQLSWLVPVRKATLVQASVLSTMTQDNMSEEFAVMFSIWQDF